MNILHHHHHHPFTCFVACFCTFSV